MTKIALCFLTYENLSQPKLWRKFIDNNKDRLNVYIHNKNDFVEDEYQLNQYCIQNRVPTKYSHKSVVEAELTLFKEAHKHDAANAFFILLSDKCVPLYNFDHIYTSIFAENSNMVASGKDHGNKCRHQDLTDREFISVEEFAKDHQWLMLNRDSVDFFINNNFLDMYSDQFAAVDEHYFGNICNKFKIPYKSQLVTYVNWADESDNKNDRPYPKTYEILTNEMIVNDVLPRNTFFMRKISANCPLPSYFDDI